MSALRVVPVLGNALSALQMATQNNPRGLVRGILQFFVTMYLIAFLVFGLNGRRIAGLKEKGDDRTFDAAAFEFTGTGGASTPARNPVTKPGDKPGSNSDDVSKPSGKGGGYDDIRQGLDRTGLPLDWADNEGLWKMLYQESNSTKKRLNYSARNPSSGALGPFQLNPSSGTLQQYAGQPPYSDNELIDGGLKYIKDRYGDMQAMIEFRDANGYY